MNIVTLLFLFSWSFFVAMSIGFIFIGNSDPSVYIVGAVLTALLKAVYEKLDDLLEEVKNK